MSEATKESTPLLKDVKGGDMTQSMDSFQQGGGVKGQTKQVFSTDTTAMRLFVNENSEITKASILLRDVITGGGAEATASKNSAVDESISDLKTSNICRLILSMKMTWTIVMSAVYVVTALSFIEHPRWCTKLDCAKLFSMHGTPAFYAGDEVGEEDVQFYPNSGTLYLDPIQSTNIEFFCLIILLIYQTLLIGRDGDFEKYFSESTGVRKIRVVQFGSIIYLMLELLSDKFILWGRPLTEIARIVIFVTFSKGCLREMNSVKKILPELVSPTVLLGIILLFYGWVGVALFSGSAEGDLYFSNLIESLYSLWIMVTTANYPDVMMPAYNENRALGLYFISFMIVAFFLMMNFILAVVCNCYNEEEERYNEALEVEVETNLSKAFQILDKEKTGEIKKKTIMGVFWVLNNDCPEVAYIPQATAELLFAILDKDGGGTIDKKEFQIFGQVMLLEFEDASPETFVQKVFPDTFNAPWFQTLRNGCLTEKFEHFIDYILIVNTLIVLVQTLPEIMGKVSQASESQNDGKLDSFWEMVELVFTMIYFFEMLSKNILMGAKTYWGSYRNQFDGIITTLSVVATCYVYYPNDFTDSRLIKYVVMIRVLRLGRLLVNVREYHDIAQALVAIVPAVSRIFILLFVVMYVYGALGMDFFGGCITRDPDNALSALLEGTDFADSEYWGNSFNDMMSSYNVLYNLLIVNNWTTEADGLLAVTGTKISRWYFITFHLFAVLVIFNIVVAIVLDSFIEEYQNNPNNKAKSIETDEAVIGGGQAVFDASSITGTQTNLTGSYVAKFKGGKAGRAAKRSMLKNLFSADQTKAV